MTNNIPTNKKIKIGTRSVVFPFDHPAPSKDNYKQSAIRVEVKNSSSKKNKCSGCSRSKRG